MVQSRLAEITQYLEGRDFSLALRRLTDCVIDTENTTIFKTCLAIHSTFEQADKNKDDYHDFEQIVKDFLPTLEENLSNVVLENNLLLSTQQLGKTYNTGGFGIRNIDTDIKQGEIVGLVGENGNGKTTLLRMLGGELNPSSGAINYHYTAERKGTYNHRSEIVFVPQSIPKWYGSLMDNLMFTNAYYNRKNEDNRLWAEIMIARLGLRAFKDLNWNRISSGYKTRFELARVLLQKPKILLLDEPLANLDIFAQQTVLQDLKYRAQSMRNPFGIFLSSQQLYEVEKISDKVIFLKNGTPQYQSMTTEVIEDNQPEQLYSAFEIESPENRAAITQALAALNPVQVKFNGGVYVISFPLAVDMSKLLLTLAQANLTVLAVRNISKSSRRFFEA